MKAKIYLDYNRNKYNLILKFSYKPRHRFNYSLGIQIDKKFWDQEKQKVKSNHPFSDALNNQIQIVLNKTLEIRNSYLASGRMDKLTNNKFREELKKSLGIISSNRDSFLIYFKSYLKSYDTKTIETYKTTLYRLEQFSKQQKFDWEDIDLIWLKRFKKFCFSNLNISPNTANVSLTHIKTVLRDGFDSEIHRNRIFENKKFSIKASNPAAIFLNMNELSKIYHCELNSEKLEAIRDIFILLCFTGQRFSDYLKLNRSNLKNINGKKYFVIIQQKGKKEVAIPLHPVALRICEKYNYKMPQVSIQIFAKKVKEVVRQAGITEKVEKIVYQDENRKEKIEKYKYELIASHTARRSFATNMYLSNVDLEKIRSVTGHSQVSMLERYIKATAVQKSEQIANTDFFSSTKFLKAI